MVIINNCCQNCGKENSQLKICDHCKGVAYCSDACEIEDKIEHSKVCSVKALAIANPELDEQNTKCNKENNGGYDDDDDDYTYDSSTDSYDEATIYHDDLFNPFTLLRVRLLQHLFSRYLDAYLANPFIHINHPFLCLICRDFKFFHVYCPKCRRISYCSQMCRLRDCFHHLVCEPLEEGRCANCRRSDVVLKKCTGCKKIEYCSKKCQRADWKKHKVLCKASKPKDGKSSGEESTEDRCARCTRSDVELTKCSGCNNVGYCSKVCQRADWEHHKTSCKTSKTEDNENSSSSSVKGQCARCKKSDAVLKKCSGCKKVEYCSKPCQKADWELHKTSCKTEDGAVSVKERCHRCKSWSYNLLYCNGCEKVKYCSRYCKISDRRNHRKNCDSRKDENDMSSTTAEIKGPVYEMPKCVVREIFRLFPFQSVLTKFEEVTAIDTMPFTHSSKEEKLIAYIYKKGYHMYKVHYEIRDVDGEIRHVMFYHSELISEPYFKWNQLKVGNYIVIIKPQIHYFLDGAIGFRINSLKEVRIINNKSC